MKRNKQKVFRAPAGLLDTDPERALSQWRRFCIWVWRMRIRVYGWWWKFTHPLPEFVAGETVCDCKGEHRVIQQFWDDTTVILDDGSVCSVEHCIVKVQQDGSCHAN